MRRVLIIVTAVAACMFGAGPAAADKPNREVIPVDDVFETEDCGFPVSVHQTGTIIRNTYTYRDGSIRIHESYPEFRWTMTNTDTGKTIEVGIPGPLSNEIAPDGSSTFTATGPWAWIPHPESGEPGIFRTRGRLVATFDSDGNLTSLSIVGTIEDLCAELAA
jgi:hypothetical protein